jgi:Rv2632c-like
MKTTDRWPVELSLTEQGRETHAEASLAVGGARVVGHGSARRNPIDPQVLAVGEKIAAARALSQLAHLLLDSAAAELEDHTHEMAHLHL